jgi:hypothetical protein
MDEYIKVRQQQAELEIKRRELEPTVIKELNKLGVKSVGPLSLREVKSYTYSPKVLKAEEKFKKVESQLKEEIKEAKIPLDLLKNEEEKKQIAKLEINYSLTYKA